MIAQEEPATNQNQSVPKKSVEGWIIIATKLNEETSEDDIFDLFSEFGEPKSVHLNMDRRRCCAKGYALIEYEKYSEAETAIRKLDGTIFLERTIKVDWVFQTGPITQNKKS